MPFSSIASYDVNLVGGVLPVVAHWTTPSFLFMYHVKLFLIEEKLDVWNVNRIDFF